MPQGYQQPGIACSGRRVTENQGYRGNYENDEAIHGQQMRLAAILVAEFRRRQHLVRQRRNRQRDFLATGYAALGRLLRFLRVLEEVLGALFVDHVNDGAANHRQEHEDDVGLHHAGRQDI